MGDILVAWAAALLLSTLAARALHEALKPWAIAGSWALVAVGVIAWRHRGAWRRFGYLPVQPLRSLAWTARYAAVVLPPFALVYLGWFGTTGWRWPSVGVFGRTFAEHLALAALPEELFFRGYVQTRLADRFGTRTVRVLGVPLNMPLVLAAALFAITHLAYTASALSPAGLARLLTFFPGVLFGALREECGDVLAPTLFHALCNAVLLTLQAGYAG